MKSIIPLHAGETDQKDSCAREAILCAQYRGAIHFERHGTPRVDELRAFRGKDAAAARE
jgi:hypothetical protein